MKETKTLGHKRSDTEAVVEERREAHRHKSDGAEYHAHDETGANCTERVPGPYHKPSATSKTIAIFMLRLPPEA